ncbi:hypothetical protein DPMN_116225 [Dreissena polymorpha]|uniref:Uncharacterized protein n=1 Tax=Dreissena polymorpha TaxID=45954 RepID=A0A9D4KN79_DREPO|nr:hypothetical protein DPMN_116225 [Dreissena polymorpha]
MREGARRDALLDSDGNRRRRALTTSSVKIRFRTMAKNGLLLYANTFAGRRLCVLSVSVRDVLSL